MFLWKLIISTVLGAVLVKEWEKASRLYDSVRTKTSAGLRTWQREAKDSGDENGPSPESFASDNQGNQ